ncbi:MAG TPA: O-antigen ligase family protein [Verrucomicrobiae bacterium]|nr:O-antigen ligase family protein [Verrucomicrobiae bacterium]
MDVKTLFGLTVIPAAFLGGILLACFSSRIRDLFFFLLVVTSPLIERLDLNYVSREWYRGTSRGFEIAIPDIFALSLLVSAILVPRHGQSRGFWPPSLGFFLLFLSYAAANVLISEPQLFGLFELFRMFRGLLLLMAVAFYVRGERELRLFVFGLAVVVCHQGLLALKQRYLEGVHRVPGTVDESNSLSVLLCTTTPVMVAALTAQLPNKLKLVCAAAIPLAMVAEVMTISRAGVTIMSLVLFLTTVATIRYRVSPKLIAGTFIVVLGVAGLAAKSWNTLATRFGESSMEQEYGNKKNMGRGYYIRMAKAIAAERFFGVGLNNWSYWVSNRFGPQHGYKFVPYKGTDREPSTIVPSDSNVDEAQAAPAHNLCALTVGELGIPGLTLFLLLWLRWFQMGASFILPRTPDPMRRIGVGLFFGSCGMFLQCLTEWVFRHLPLYYTFHIMLGVLMSLYYLKRKTRREQEQDVADEAEFSPVTPAGWVDPLPAQGSGV